MIMKSIMTQWVKEKAALEEGRRRVAWQGAEMGAHCLLDDDVKAENGGGARGESHLIRLRLNNSRSGDECTVLMYKDRSRPERIMDSRCVRADDGPAIWSAHLHRYLGESGFQGAHYFIMKTLFMVLIVGCGWMALEKSVFTTKRRAT